MFKFKSLIALAICFNLLLPVQHANAMQIKSEALIITSLFGASVIIFWEQLEKHWVAFCAPAIFSTLLYLFIERQWYKGLEGRIHQLANFLVPPEPILKPPPPAAVPPPHLHINNYNMQHPASGRRLKDMARLPYS